MSSVLRVDIADGKTWISACCHRGKPVAIPSAPSESFCPARDFARDIHIQIFVTLGANATSRDLDDRCQQ